MIGVVTHGQDDKSFLETLNLPNSSFVFDADKLNLDDVLAIIKEKGIKLFMIISGQEASDEFTSNIIQELNHSTIDNLPKLLITKTDSTCEQLKVFADITLKRDDIINADFEQVIQRLTDYKDIVRSVFKNLNTTYGHGVNNIIQMALWELSKLEEKLGDKSSAKLEEHLYSISNFLKKVENLESPKVQRYEKDVNMYIVSDGYLQEGKIHLLNSDLEKIIDANRNPLVICDRRYKIVYLNESFATEWQQEKELIINQDIFKFTQGLSKDQLLKLADGTSVFESKQFNKHKMQVQKIILNDAVFYSFLYL